MNTEVEAMIEGEREVERPNRSENPLVELGQVSMDTHGFLLGAYLDGGFLLYWGG